MNPGCSALLHLEEQVLGDDFIWMVKAPQQKAQMRLSEVCIVGGKRVSRKNPERNDSHLLENKERGSYLAVGVDAIL